MLPNRLLHIVELQSILLQRLLMERHAKFMQQCSQTSAIVNMCTSSVACAQPLHITAVYILYVDQTNISCKVGSH